MRKRIGLVAAFAFGLAVGATAIVSAQVDKAKAVTKPQSTTTFTITTDTAGNILNSTEVKPQIVTTPDVGIRVDGRHSGRVVGTLVARIDGEWVEVQLSPLDSLLKR